MTAEYGYLNCPFHFSMLDQGRLIPVISGWLIQSAILSKKSSSRSKTGSPVSSPMIACQMLVMDSLCFNAMKSASIENQFIIPQRCEFVRANNDRKVIQANKIRQELAPKQQMSKHQVE